MKSFDLFTVSETAAILGVSKRLVQAWIEQKRLPAIQLGQGPRHLRVRRVDLEQFVKNDFQPSVPPGRGGSLREKTDGKGN